MTDYEILSAIHTLHPNEYQEGQKMVNRISVPELREQASRHVADLKFLAHSAFGKYADEHYVSGWS